MNRIKIAIVLLKDKFARLFYPTPEAIIDGETYTTPTVAEAVEPTTTEVPTTTPAPEAPKTAKSGAKRISASSRSRKKPIKKKKED